MRPLSANPSLTREARLRELAAILAAGISRLRARAALAVDSDEHSASENTAKSGPTCLEVPDETVLSVPAG